MALLDEATPDSARDAIGLHEGSRVLVISTEGDTDPDQYRAVVESS